jgi:DNA-binding NarL/FixJ family response regulator
MRVPEKGFLWVVPSMAASAIRVLLVDDDAAFLESLEALLASDQPLEIVGKALKWGRGAQDRRCERAGRCVVDVRMPGMSGIECGRLIRECDPNSRVILISGSIFDDQRPAPTESRASAYLAKSEVTARLHATLVEVMAAP